MWSYLTQQLALTDDKRPVDRSGVLNSMIRDYVKSLGPIPKDKPPTIPTPK
jgi:hypothetical protein